MEHRLVSRVNLALLTLLLVPLILIIEPGTPAGDGSDYYKMVFLMAETGKPFFDQDSAQQWEAFRSRPELEWPDAPPHHRRLTTAESRKARHMTNEQNEWEVHHFGLYSILAIPFYFPLKWLGFHAGYAFICEHAALLLLAYFTLRKRQGGLEFPAFFLLIASSPVLWFINQAHTEFFTVTVTTLAISSFARAAYLEAALFFAAAATQNIPWCFPALVCCLMFLRQRGIRSVFSRYNLSLSALIGTLALLQPLYYLVRIGKTNPVFKIGRTSLMESSIVEQAREMTCWWIDPDLGLLANWWLGCIVILASAYFAARRKLDLGWRYWVFAVSTTIVLLLSNSATLNFNHGGTRYVSRYALWYMFVFLLPMTRLMQLASARLRTRARISVAAIALATLGAANFATYRPSLPEVYLQSGPFAQWLYTNLPWAYNPVPRIFRERAGRIPIPPGKLQRNADKIWAISNPTCTKILVNPRALDSLDRQSIPKPLFCDRALGPLPIYREAQALAARNPDAQYFYLNRRLGSQELPAYRLGTWMGFAPRADPESFHYLDSGWRHSVPPADSFMSCTPIPVTAEPRTAKVLGDSTRISPVLSKIT